MALIEVKVPDIGDFKDIAVIELLVQPGQTVKAEQSLVTVESDKASMEIPSSASGVIKELRVKLGDKVSEGSPLALLEVSDVERSASSVERDQPKAGAPTAGVPPAQRSTPNAQPAAGPAGGVEVRVPDIGDFKDIAVIELLVKPGDVVKPEQSLITVESDKASMEIPSSAGGTVRELKVKLGDKVSQGSVIAVVDTTAGTAPSAPAAATGSPPPQSSPSSGPEESPTAAPPSEPARAAQRTVPTAALPPHEPAAPSGELPHASPSVRKFARELGVPLDEVKGTGPKGRITQEDVQAFTKAVMRGDTSTKAAGGAKGGADGGAALGLLPWPQVDFEKFGPVERQELGRIRRIAAANLHRNWVMIPHVTNHDEADITELEAFRVQLNKEQEKAGIKVTMLAFLIKACVAALKQFPTFNSSLDGEQLVIKQYWHIGFAADTPNGLMVPVLKDADRKGILQISQELADLSARARGGKLSPSEMTGATFTISSLGGIGGTYFTPIINAPEVAILGVCRSTTKPVWDGRQFAPRLILPLSLSWDHRVVDGASAARFNAFLGAILADFRRTML
jgi:pyruvate dehydrogenase E2 component (dihydrolipoamide acetyltransferase)